MQLYYMLRWRFCCFFIIMIIRIRMIMMIILKRIFFVFSFPLLWFVSFIHPILELNFPLHHLMIKKSSYSLWHFLIIIHNIPFRISKIKRNHQLTNQKREDHDGERESMMPIRCSSSLSENISFRFKMYLLWEMNVRRTEECFKTGWWSSSHDDLGVSPSFSLSIAFNDDHDDAIRNDDHCLGVLNLASSSSSSFSGWLVCRPSLVSLSLFKSHDSFISLFPLIPSLFILTSFLVLFHRLLLSVFLFIFVHFWLSQNPYLVPPTFLFFICQPSLNSLLLFSSSSSSSPISFSFEAQAEAQTEKT